MAVSLGRSQAEIGGAVRKAYLAIREGIVQGVYAPGSRLREEHLAEAVGVSRTPVREALRLLATEGMVDLTTGQGAFVTSWSPQDLENVFAVRAMIESNVAGLATRHLRKSEIVGLSELARQMEDLAERRPRGFLDQITGLNQTFHTTIANACGNDRLTALLTQTVELIVVHGTFRRYRSDQLRRSMAHHRELIDAFTARDGDWASSIMKCHVLAAKNALLNNIAQPSGQSDEEDAGQEEAMPARM